MGPQNLLGTAATIVTMLVGFVTITIFLYRLSSDVNKTRGLLFRRFDEFKAGVEEKMKEQAKAIEEKYVQNKLCKIVHAQGAKDTDRLEKKLDTFIKEFGEKLDQKFGELNANLMNFINKKP